MTPDEIRAECDDLWDDIERFRDELDSAEDRLGELQEECGHTRLVRTGATWPNVDQCPDCGRWFYLAGGQEEEQAGRKPGRRP